MAIANGCFFNATTRIDLKYGAKDPLIIQVFFDGHSQVTTQLLDKCLTRDVLLNHGM